jgi:hypothetical protein
MPILFITARSVRLIATFWSSKAFVIGIYLDLVWLGSLCFLFSIGNWINMMVAVDSHFLDSFVILFFQMIFFLPVFCFSGGTLGVLFYQNEKKNVLPRQIRMDDELSLEECIREEIAASNI